MDLWNKLFSPKPKGNFDAYLTKCSNSSDWEVIVSTANTTSSSSGTTNQSIHTFDEQQVRVLLYRECDRRGRKLLYDSKTVVRITLKEQIHESTARLQIQSTPPPLQKTINSSSSRCSSGTQGFIGSSQHTASSQGGAKPPISGNPTPKPRRNDGGTSYLEIRDGFGYQYLKESLDTKQLGELVFGAVALAYKGSSSKLHLLKDPSGFLFSRTSTAPRSYKSPQTSCDTGIEDSFSSLCSDSLGDLQMTKFEGYRGSSLHPSVPLEMGSVLRSSLSEEDSGFSGPPSPFSSICGSYLTPSSHPPTPLGGTPSSRNGSGNSLKNSGGSLNSLQRRFLRTITTSLDSIGFCSGDEDKEEPSPLFQTKLGLAVVVHNAQSSMTKWLFDHQEVLEAAMNKLQFSLESAYHHRATFVSCVFQAVAQFQQELVDLFTAPRLVDPIWLSLIKSDQSKEKDRLHLRLASSLSCLLQNYDTKNTNFFVSKLLTGVLTHHLGWVATVIPQTSTLGEKKSADKLNFSLVNLFPSCQPYNALWSQLSELSGAIGFPSRTTKTVVVGTDRTLLNHILVILSYLIRCSLVEEVELNKGASSKSTLYDSKSSFGSEETAVLVSENSKLQTEFKLSKKLMPENIPLKLKETTNVSKSNAKWMLFDEEDIVIDKEKKCSDSSSDFKSAIVTSANEKVCSEFRTCKTFDNLATLSLSDSASSSDNWSPSFTNLYPNLNEFHCQKSATECQSVVKPSDDDSITVSGQDITLEEEEGGKVLFISGENEKLEGLQNTNETNIIVSKLPSNGSKVEDNLLTSSPPSMKETNSVCCNVENENRPKGRLKSSEIFALSPPLEFPKRETFRRQGKSVTNLERTSIPRKHFPFPLIYPSLESLKRQLSPLPNLSAVKISSKTHRRSHSEPVSYRPQFTPDEKIKINFQEKSVSSEKSTNDKCWNSISTAQDDGEMISIENVDIPLVETGTKVRSLGTAESLIGGIVDHYSPIFVLHATTNGGKLEDLLRVDLMASSQKPVLDNRVTEAIALVADINSWDIELVSSHAFSVDRRLPSINYGGVPLMMSPLVSQMTDSLVNLVKLAAPPHFLIHCLENHLREIYIKSELLSKYLLEDVQFSMSQTDSSSSERNSGDHKLYDLPQLTRNLGFDVNDLPLLLSVASTHTPALTQMFGLTFK